MKRMMYLILLSTVAVLLLTTVAIAQSTDPTQDPTQAQGPTPSGVEVTPITNALTIDIHDDAFDPDPAAVDPGTIVTWVNEDTDPHTVTADDGSFDSGTLNAGDSYSVTFGGAGTMGYHCKIHPDMKGSVVVGGDSGGETTTTGQPASDSTQTPDMGGDTTNMSSGY